jgi:hypothetical protein
MNCLEENLGERDSEETEIINNGSLTVFLEKRIL